MKELIWGYCWPQPHAAADHGKRTGEMKRRHSTKSLFANSTTIGFCLCDMTTCTQTTISQSAADGYQTGWDDQAFASWLQARTHAQEEVVIVHADFLWKVYAPANVEPNLVAVDPDSLAKKKLKEIARKGLLKTLPLPRDEISASFRPASNWVPHSTTPDVIETMVNSRLSALGRVGRGQPISDSTAFRVWADAGARCMFHGCADDLGRIPLHTKAAKVGYLAHIVASDPRGPRGNIRESHALADDPENIMLMCDAHHRLIDSFAAADYEAPRLREMRARHVGFVRRHLNALAFPKVQGVTLLADLGGVPTNFHEADAVEAVLSMGGNLLPQVSDQLRHTGRDDRGAPGFWANYLHQHQLHITQFVNEFGGARHQPHAELAIFPIHHTPTLVLAGRIVGEAQRVRVYQHDRHRQTWQWDPAAVAQAPGTFSVQYLGDFDGGKEILLTIELTAFLAETALPVGIADGVTTNVIPHVRLTIPKPNNSCIQHPNDLAQFVQVARSAISRIHDEFRPVRVHLIVLAPASSVFAFGQLLQAGHHPTYLLYDRASGQDKFIEAFSIDGHLVHPPTGSNLIPIQIR
ncbi:SAVED domain-containing protein [Bordetella bronchialis]|uniref:SAVED domain-containing protein n=1 Tax=Bordetella bronchialis TaxID=463025 RepID=UPI003D075098